MVPVELQGASTSTPSKPPPFFPPCQSAASLTTTSASSASRVRLSRSRAVRPGERVADLCAAPGGKTAQLAAAGASVVAVERDPMRLALLRDRGGVGVVLHEARAMSEERGRRRGKVPSPRAGTHDRKSA